MTRSIISKFIIVLVLLFTALSVFWFFKTSSLKKQALALISSSGGNVSAVSVSVAGFPLQQKLSFDDLKIQLSIPSSIPNLNLIANNKYQITVKKLEASASIFSGDFVINNIGETSFQDQNGAINSVQFNQPPQASFSVVNGNLVKLSYQDSGYKIIDGGKNLLFENGNSSVSFDSVIENDKYRNKLKADFKDVGALSFINDIAASTPDNTVSDLNVKAVNPNAGDPAIASDAAAPVVVEAAKPVEAPVVGGNLVKKTLSLELEYVVAKPSAASIPVPNPSSQNTATSDIVSGENVLESVSIRNFEVSSPLYKLNINGEITSFQKDNLPICSISIRIEKLDNVLTYIKKSITSFSNINNPNNPNKVENITDPASNPEVGNAVLTTSDSATAPASNQKPEIDLASIIKDLAKKNIATNEEIAVFDLRKEADKDLLINETSWPEIVSQIFVTSAANQSNIKSDNPNVVVDPAAVKNSIPNNSSNIAPAPIAAPAVPAPVRPKNAN